MFSRLMNTFEGLRLEDHTVRISDENLERLKNYKTKWNMSYNDIIGMGLKLFDGNTEDDYLKTLDKTQLLAMCSSLKTEVQQQKDDQIDVRAPVYKIKVSLNRVRINDGVKSLLNSGYDLFIPEITHRQAMYVKRKLKSMGYECDYVKSEGDGKYGFLFTQPNVKSNMPKRNVKSHIVPVP